MEKNDMCGACSMHGADKFVQGFGRESWEKENLEYKGIQGKIILNGFSEIGISRYGLDESASG